MATETPNLRIAIIGSGLAGLAAARVLRSHHTVTVYERGTASTATGGQGTIATPNAVKILEPLGFDRARVRSVRCSGYRTFDKVGNVVGDRPLDLKQRYGADWYMHLRADYRDELLRLATAPGEEVVGKEDAGEPARVVFETAVVDVDPEKGTFELSDGSRGEADVIIGTFVVACLLSSFPFFNHKTKYRRGIPPSHYYLKLTSSTTSRRRHPQPLAPPHHRRPLPPRAADGHVRLPLCRVPFRSRAGARRRRPAPRIL